MKKFLSLFVLTLLTWILISGISIEELVSGSIVAAIISFLLYKKYGFDFGLKIAGPFVFILVYIPVFILELIKANFDVASRVIKKDIPLNPGFVKITTGIQSNLGKLILANSITLTPGTMTVEIIGNDLFIHWIDVKGSNPEEYLNNIAGRFEKILKGVFHA